VIPDEKTAEENEQARGADGASVYGRESLRVLVEIGVAVPDDECDDPIPSQEVQGKQSMVNAHAELSIPVVGVNDFS
jgi:hypothetical protein